MNTGFPYTVTESFMDLFEGLTYDQTDAALAESMHEQVVQILLHVTPNILNTYYSTRVDLLTSGKRQVSDIFNKFV